jgi:hypothetical protein
MGRGAFSQVWKAWQVRTHKWVAMKVFLDRGGVNWLFLQREMERLIRLDKHPHIVSLLDADLAGEQAYYVMDLMGGGSLEQFVDPAHPAPAEKASVWMEEIAQALAYVHSKGLIHCDLKPANILLDEEGHIRVADFGQSRIVTESSGALGTLFYMAPEQAVTLKDDAQIQPDVRWDVYGLGATLYALLAGQAPHGDAENTRRLNEAKTLDEKLDVYREIVKRQPLRDLASASGGRIDQDLAAIIDKCAKPAPGQRYMTLAEVQADLRARRDVWPVSPLANRKAYRWGKFLQRNMAKIVATLAAGAALAMTLGLFAYRLHAHRRLDHDLLAQDEKLQEQLADGFADTTAKYMTTYEDVLRQTARLPDFHDPAKLQRYLDQILKVHLAITEISLIDGQGKEIARNGRFLGPHPELRDLKSDEDFAASLAEETHVGRLRRIQRLYPVVTISVALHDPTFHSGNPTGRLSAQLSLNPLSTMLTMEFPRSGSRTAVIALKDGSVAAASDPSLVYSENPRLDAEIQRFARRQAADRGSGVLMVSGAKMLVSDVTVKDLDWRVYVQEPLKADAGQKETPAAAAPRSTHPPRWSTRLPPGWKDITKDSKLRGLLLALRGPDNSALVVSRVGRELDQDDRPNRAAYLVDVLAGINAGSGLGFLFNGSIKKGTAPNGNAMHSLTAELHGKPRLTIAVLQFSGEPIVVSLTCDAPETDLPFFLQYLRKE